MLYLIRRLTSGIFAEQIKLSIESKFSDRQNYQVYSNMNAPREELCENHIENLKKKRR